MRRVDENFVTMANVTMGVMDTHTAAWGGRAPIADCVNRIKDALETIESTRRGSGSAVSTGATMDKEEAADEAMDLALELAGYAQAYARRQGNNELLQQMKSYKRRSMERGSDDALTETLQDMHNRLTAIQAAAATYGITTDKLTELQAAITAYDELKNKPRTVILTRKGLSSTVPEQLKVVREELRDLDMLMEAFARNEQGFYTSYKNARIIVDRGGAPDEGDVTQP